MNDLMIMLVEGGKYGVLIIIMHILVSSVVCMVVFSTDDLLSRTVFEKRFKNND